MEVQIEITTKCNMKCYYCPIEEMDNKHMDYELAIDIVDSYPRGTLFKLQGTGEPSLYPHLLNLILYIKKSGSKTHIISNGKKAIDFHILDSLDSPTISIDEDTSSNAERETKTLDKVIDVLCYSVPIMGKKNMSIMTVDFGQKTPLLDKIAISLGVEHKKQILQTKSVYQTKYSTEAPAPKHFSCIYTLCKKLDFYFRDGKKAACCFMVKKEIAKTREEVQASFNEGTIPESCDGCYLLAI